MSISDDILYTESPAPPNTVLVFIASWKCICHEKYIAVWSQTKLILQKNLAILYTYVYSVHMRVGNLVALIWQS